MSLPFGDVVLDELRTPDRLRERGDRHHAPVAVATSGTTAAEAEFPSPAASPGPWTRPRGTCPEDALYYLCGPLPFMYAVREQLIDRKVAPRDIQYEVFVLDRADGAVRASRRCRRSDLPA